MNRYITKGIVLNRTDYGEADRIIHFLTTDHGKIATMAKGVRRSKAKLAGSVELFSISDLTILPGKSDIDTLMSARLDTHFGNIVKDLSRTELGFELLRRADKATEDQPEPGYFETLALSLAGLNNIDLDPALVELWFNLRILKLSGHSPNLEMDYTGKPLAEAKNYEFKADHMNFAVSGRGRYNVNHIKLLRLATVAKKPDLLGKVKGVDELAKPIVPLVQTMLQTYVRL